MKNIFMILLCCLMLIGCGGNKNEEYQPPAIEEFEYSQSGNFVKLESYNGKDKILEIKASYEIGNKEYQIDLSDIYLSGSKVETIIFDEGIKEIGMTIFNSCNVKNIYFPSTMKYVYDYTLSYLHPEKGEKIQIYYAGTEEEWDEIFLEYENSSDNTGLKERWDNADSSYEKGEAVGGFLAEKLNSLTRVNLNTYDFEFHYESSPDDLKNNKEG